MSYDKSYDQVDEKAAYLAQAAQQRVGTSLEVGPSSTVFTQVTGQLVDHTRAIRDMASNVRRCCDVLDGSVPESASLGDAKEDLALHQIPRLHQALGEQNGEIEYLKSQLARLDTILSGKS
jgi:hypothetical protein